LFSPEEAAKSRHSLKSDDRICEDYPYPDTIDLIGQLRPPRARLINVHDDSSFLIVDVRRTDANA
jgi:hypothetical protein